jgi:hypothetical protein
LCFEFRKLSKEEEINSMSIRLNLSLLTILAAFSATIPGCGDDADSDPDTGGDAGETSTGGKATGTGGKATSDAGSTGEDAGAPSTGGKSGTGGAGGAPTTDAGAPSTDAGAPGEAGSTGTGGSSTGGASSTGGKSGGEGGAPAGGECRAPQCLIDVAAGCAPEGECTMGGFDFDPQNPPMNLDDLSIAICWENGVKAGMKAVGTESASFEYQKDGDVCYTADFALEGGETTEILYKNADGELFATQTVDRDANTVTITCQDGSDSVTYSPDDCGSDDEQPGQQPDTSQCAMDATCALD